MSDLICYPSFFKAIGHPIRQMILTYLNKNGEVTVSQITDALNISTSNAEYHLSVLLKERIIIADESNGSVLYSIHCQTIKECCDLVQKNFLDEGALGKSHK